MDYDEYFNDFEEAHKKAESEKSQARADRIERARKLCQKMDIALAELALPELRRFLDSFRRAFPHAIADVSTTQDDYSVEDVSISHIRLVTLHHSKNRLVIESQPASMTFEFYAKRNSGGEKTAQVKLADFNDQTVKKTVGEMVAWIYPKP